jgi:hypothetical protein
MNPMTSRNPFTVLGLPAWPDLDDETVDAAWAAIAAETNPARPDGGNLARYTRAAAAYAQIRLAVHATVIVGLYVAAVTWIHPRAWPPSSC